ncbi:hypothetical protein BCL57_001675 [Agromyces flavus]|uniref:Uncharacterized protein n=1 Tax=Agromyces flavus TaxID=589382 RepID=A0A1H1LCT4_9MICO|nr:hypothetical protein [Agromyces flavus]MCP2367521.1 hypothetical protein [Agromyces flavus]GGI45564.1 hypothetical protein GCM10010932_10180 [Agromyces flavus]SDR72237.1 hypothetical protein SAMN04489721_0085 [Agromyces flavus]
MLDSPHRPGDQTYDGLLLAEDLPEGWNLPSRFPGERDDDASAQIDAVLGYDDSATTESQMNAHRTSDENGTMDGRWRYLEHEATHTRVMIRLQRQLFAVPEEIRITGVIYLPWRPGDPITSQLLRELPTARIEAAINKRLFAMKRRETITGGKIVLPSGRKVSERDLLKPLGDPKKVPDFYELVALQHGRLTQQGDANPSATMAEINGVALSTAQGWITKARDRGLLPPGRRGRAG